MVNLPVVTKKEKDHTVWHIVGGSVGGTIFVVAVAIIAVCAKKKKKEKSYSHLGEIETTIIKQE